MSQIKNKNFSEQMAAQTYRAGELACMELLHKIGYQNVQDVSKIPSYQSTDIDILAYKDGSQLKIEVKTDNQMWKYGNIFTEIIQDKFSYRYYTGWFYQTTADVLCYIDNIGTKQHGKIFYLLDFKTYKAYVEQKKFYFQERECSTKDNYGNLHRSVGLCVPVELFQRQHPEAIEVYYERENAAAA